MTDIALAGFYALTCLYLGGVCAAGIIISLVQVDLARVPRVFRSIARGLHIDQSGATGTRTVVLRWTAGLVAVASQIVVAAMLVDPMGRLGYGLAGQVIAVVEFAALFTWVVYVVRRFRTSQVAGGQ